MNKKTLFLIILTTVLILPFGILAEDAVDTTPPVCGATTGGNVQLEAILGRVTDAASTLGAGLAILGFIIAGILFLTAAGSPEKMGVARKALIAAVIGTAVVALAQGANIMNDIFCKIITGS